MNNRPVVLEINGRDKTSAPHCNPIRTVIGCIAGKPYSVDGEHSQEHYASRRHTQRWHTACLWGLTMSAITAESLLLFDDGDRKEILIDTNQRGVPSVQAALMDLMNKHPGIKHRFVTLSDLREARKSRKLNRRPAPRQD